MSCCTAEARKSSLLVPNVFWNVVGKLESAIIHDWSLKPIIALSRLKVFDPIELRSADKGLVGKLGLKLKFIKLFASPLPWAIEVFQKSNCCFDAEGQSPQALFVP